MKLFTTTEVAKILTVPRSRVQSFVRAGFISPSRNPGNKLQFTFQDLLLLKTAKALFDSHVAPKKIMRMLGSLKRQLPGDQHLSRVKVYVDGQRVVALDGNARWQPDSGQFVFNFAAQTLARQARLPRPAAKPKNKELSADDWFERALELEATSATQAERAYRAALTLDPEMTDAHVNLGHLYHDAGNWEKAEKHYQAAAASSPNDAAPLFNLGVLMEDRKQPDKAIRAYRQALQRDPSYADAHYNLGLILEALGKKAEAISHLSTARKIYLRR